MDRMTDIMNILRSVVRDGTGNRDFLEAQAKKIIALFEGKPEKESVEDTDEPTI